MCERGKEPSVGSVDVNPHTVRPRYAYAFFDRIDPQTIGFLTLFHDGTLTLSSHDASNGTTAATASSGTCKKAAE